MQYTELGKTGRRVSRIGFGGAPAGLTNYLHAYDPRVGAEREDVIAAIRKAWELGINYFDTAPGYGDGQSESIFGEALQGIPSQELFIATKVPVWGGVDVRRSVEESLKRLGRDYLDLIQIHGTSYSPEEMEKVLQGGGIAEQMARLKDEGLVRHIGFTSEDQNVELYTLIRSGLFDVMQMCYNLIYQHPCDPSRKSGSLYEAEKEGLGIVTMRAATSMIFQKWVRLVNPDNTFDYSAALIQFVLSNPLVDVVLTGMRSPDIVMENVQLCDELSGRIDLESLHNRYI